MGLRGVTDGELMGKLLMGLMGSFWCWTHGKLLMGNSWGSYWWDSWESTNGELMGSYWWDSWGVSDGDIGTGMRTHGKLLTHSLTHSLSLSLSLSLFSTKQFFIGLAIIGFIHYKWGYAVPLLTQLVMNPIRLYGNNVSFPSEIALEKSLYKDNNATRACTY